MIRRECTEPYWLPEMPKEYYADACRLSHLWQHRNLYCPLETIRSAPMSQIFPSNSAPCPAA